VRVSQVLPWAHLFRIAARALAAAIPAFWITRTVHLAPLPLAICAGAAYALTYGALVYSLLGWDGVAVVKSRLKPAPTTV
jgi:hypothetical protein